MQVNSRTYTSQAPRMREFLIDIWSHRRLLYFLVWRLFKIRYKQTYLGALWALIKPILPGFIFASLFALGSRTVAAPPFIIVYLSYLLWYVFQSGLLDAINSFEYDRAVVTRVAFPKVLVPLSHVIFRVSDSRIAFSLSYGLILLFSSTSFSFILISTYLTALMFIGFVTCTFSLVLSPLHIRFRDVGIITTFLIQVGFFLSPVFITAQSPLSLQVMGKLNPFSPAVEIFFGTYTPYELVLVWGICLVTIMSAGYFFKQKSEAYFEML